MEGLSLSLSFIKAVLPYGSTINNTTTTRAKTTTKTTQLQNNTTTTIEL